MEATSSLVGSKPRALRREEGEGEGWGVECVSLPSVPLVLLSFSHRSATFSSLASMAPVPSVSNRSNASLNEKERRGGL